MGKLLICVLLMVGILAVSETTNPVVLAQATKKDKDTKKDTKSGPGVIEIREGKDGKYRFFVRGSDDKLLAMSSPGGFTSEKDARQAIDTLKDVISKAKVTSAKKASTEK